MVNIAQVLSYLFPLADSFRDYLVVDDGKGQSITKWNSAKLGPQPTQAEIDAAAPAAQAAQLRETISAERDRRKEKQGYVAGSKRFHSDSFSRIQQIGLVILGANMPAGIMWKTMDGSFVEMTPTLAQQIFGAAAAFDMSLFAHGESLKAQVAAAADPATVDITVGWPE